MRHPPRERKKRQRFDGAAGAGARSALDDGDTAVVLDVGVAMLTTTRHAFESASLGAGANGTALENG